MDEPDIEMNQKQEVRRVAAGSDNIPFQMSDEWSSQAKQKAAAKARPPCARLPGQAALVALMTPMAAALRVGRWKAGMAATATMMVVTAWMAMAMAKAMTTTSTAWTVATNSRRRRPQKQKQG
eukprot:2275955-Pleurochrysis_carterae.AAC.5